MIPLSNTTFAMYAFTQDKTAIPCVNQDMLILSLAINWKSKRVLNIEPEKLAYRAFDPLLIPNSREKNKNLFTSLPDKRKAQVLENTLDFSS